MVLLGEGAQVEAWFGLFGDSANLQERQVHVCMEHTIKSIWMQPMELLDDVCHMESCFSSFGDCQFWCKLGAQFVPNAPQSKKPFWMHLFVLLGEEAQVEAQFGMFGDIANLDARQMHSLQGTYHMLRNQFGHPMELLDDVCHMESHFRSFGDSVSFGARQVHSLRLMHHRLRNHFGHNRWYSQVKGLKWKLSTVCLEIVLIFMYDRCTIYMEHTICSRINMDATNRTPR